MQDMISHMPAIVTNFGTSLGRVCRRYTSISIPISIYRGPEGADATSYNLSQIIFHVNFHFQLSEQRHGQKLPSFYF
jgi:hypothetical protein